MKQYKVNIGGYEISMKAKCRFINEKYNDQDTKDFLNMLSLILGESSELFKRGYEEDPEKDFLKRMSEYRRSDAEGIYDILDELNYYMEDKNDGQNE